MNNLLKLTIDAHGGLDHWKNFGNPANSSEDDIYSKGEQVPFIEDGSDATLDDDKTENALTGENLDVPGAELDDANEEIGEEDEENNYYSLGGDNHDDLEEQKA
ncbi:MAG TPA: hypothetical protein VJU78_04200 [Chitinophagaceae bacterium]|nr:hypothetical protein [Chitinophagaceae bacterium]